MIPKALRVGFSVSSHFLPFILFWMAVMLMKFHPGTALLASSFLNAEVAVRFWLGAGYPYLIAITVCIICGNVDLIVWFWFFGEGRYLLEREYPKIGLWLVSRFPENGQPVTANGGLSGRLNRIFNGNQKVGLVAMGFTPFLDIVIGVPLAVASDIKTSKAYFFMAVGNALKITIFGLIIANNFTLSLLVMGLVCFWLFRKIAGGK